MWGPPDWKGWRLAGRSPFLDACRSGHRALRGYEPMQAPPVPSGRSSVVRMPVRGGDHVGDGVHDPAGRGQDRRVVVVAAAAGRADVDDIRTVRR